MLLWNTQENGDAEKADHFLTMERDVGIRSVAWISENQIALGLQDGRIEIFQIDDIKQETTTERIIKRFEHSESWVSTGNYQGKEERDTFCDEFHLLEVEWLDRRPAME